jgi:probable F420-dependent oxidoreductase
VRITLAPWGATIAELASVATRAEAVGFDAIWVSELHRSSTVTLAAVAASTSTVSVGTAISLAFVRSPMTTALEALDLDEISGGRLLLGLGSGVQRLNESWHNARWGKPVGHLRETVRDIRAFVASADRGEPIDLDGEFEPMHLRGYRRPFPPTRRAIPIYLASTGPVMTRLAGELADGWIAHELGSPRYLEQVIRPNLAAGALATSRSEGEIDVVASACCVPWEDGALARRWAAGIVAFYATVRTYEAFFDFHGFGAEARRCQAAFRAGDEVAQLAAVSDEMVDALTIAGTPDEVRKRLQTYAGLADAVKLSPPTHFVLDEVTRAVQEELITMVSER